MASVAPRAEGAPSLGIAYLASLEQGDAKTPDAPACAIATAAILVRAFAPVVPPDVREAVVSGLFGGPAAWGVALAVRFERKDGAWTPGRVEAARPTRVPPLPARVDRRVSRENGAVATARRFLEALDRGDRDDAWELVSAAVKATTSRRTFEHRIAGATEASPRGAERRECFREYVARAGDFTLGDVLDVCFETAAGAERVQVRLDDDQEWRVARVAHFVGEDAAATSGAPALDSHARRDATPAPPSRGAARQQSETRRAIDRAPGR